ncbi:helix-turn-helix domain-containing protein [Actinokineospora spheciospongiae]|uniref:helix-turn-helix domain-containing protein n=1 Tax=Actinokineospora spheciospongiae TaxID=909613 RepID=UPI000D709FE1|nr:helix-turn-helix transcriptional regulator [Actinokineospora spheciospongiae]PWW52274.1 helix-turn-helix protein [Actinokineospora spheciospongiae]
MSGQRKNPQARDRTIGAQLKAVRVEQTSLNLEAAAKAIGWSTATLSRTENGKRHITSEDVATVLAIYGVPIAQREELIESARVGTQAGWWSRPLPGVLPDVGTLASYEASARAITDWSLTIVPGLLQTERYAKGIMVDDGAAPESIEMLWIARLRRQQVLPKVEYVAFIHESALRRAFGGADALREQLGHLMDAVSRGYSVRIVREPVPHRVLMHSWMLLDFPEAAPVLHVELHGSSIYLHDSEVHGYENMRLILDRLALSSAESRSMIERLRERL